MAVLIFQSVYFLSHAWGAKKNCHLKYSDFSDFLAKMGEKTHNHCICIQKTNDFLLEKLIRHTWMAIVTTEYVQVGQNIFWLQLKRRYTWRLEYCPIFSESVKSDGLKTIFILILVQKCDLGLPSNSRYAPK